MASAAPTATAKLTGDTTTVHERLDAYAQDRVDARRGQGLGLSIVEAVATAHGGTVRAEALDGGGMAVVVSLPAR